MLQLSPYNYTLDPLTWENFTHLVAAIARVLLHLGTIVLVVISWLGTLMVSGLNRTHLMHLILLMLLIGALSLIRKDILIISTGRPFSRPNSTITLMVILMSIVLLLLLMLVWTVSVAAPREFYRLKLNHLSAALVTLSARATIQTGYFRRLSIATLSLVRRKQMHRCL